MKSDLRVQTLSSQRAPCAHGTFGRSMNSRCRGSGCCCVDSVVMRGEIQSVWYLSIFFKATCIGMNMSHVQPLQFTFSTAFWHHSERYWLYIQKDEFLHHCNKKATCVSYMHQLLAEKEVVQVPHGLLFSMTLFFFRIDYQTWMWASLHLIHIEPWISLGKFHCDIFAILNLGWSNREEKFAKVQWTKFQPFIPIHNISSLEDKPTSSFRLNLPGEPQTMMNFPTLKVDILDA